MEEKHVEAQRLWMVNRLDVEWDLRVPEPSWLYDIGIELRHFMLVSSWTPPPPPPTQSSP